MLPGGSHKFTCCILPFVGPFKSKIVQYYVKNNNYFLSIINIVIFFSFFNFTAMPWFGVDIGGTLAKLVYFEPDDVEPTDDDPDLEPDALANIQHYLKSNTAYGTTGVRDVHLQINDVTILGHHGSLHFIRFPTSSMNAFLDMVKEKNLSSLADTVHATGGGAYKFERDFMEVSLLDLYFIQRCGP